MAVTRLTGAKTCDNSSYVLPANICFLALVVSSQGQLTLAQKFFLSILNLKGKRMVSATIQEGTTLYPPGEDRLKNIVTNYASLTGSDKWLLGSIMLLVFRPLLVDVSAMVSAIGPSKLSRPTTIVVHA